MAQQDKRLPLLLTPALIVITVMMSAYGYFAYSSFFLKGPLGSQLTGPVTLENYYRVISSPSNRYVLFSTLWASFVIAMISTGVAVPMALIIVRAKRQWVANLIMLSIAITFLSGGVTRAYSWLILLGNRGLVNLSLVEMGLVDKPLRFLYSWLGVGISIVHYLLPFTVFTLIGAVRNLNPAVEEAARGLGASRSVTFWRVTIPMLLPGLMVTLTLVYSIALASFLFPMLLGGGKVLMIANQIYDRMFIGYDVPYAAATSVVFLISAFLSIWLITVLSKLVKRVYL